jgi:hypothetical protein
MLNEIIDYLYSINCCADIKIEEIAQDLLSIMEQDEEPEDYEEPDLEMGYDPYMGCYSDDC